MQPQNTKTVPQHSFSGVVEHAIAHIEEVAVHTLPEEQQRFFAIKIFERDEKIIEQLDLTQDNRKHIETDIEAAEKSLMTTRKASSRTSAMFTLLPSSSSATRKRTTAVLPFPIRSIRS